MEWIKVAEYAKIKHLSPVRIYEKVKRNTIAHKKIKGQIYIALNADQIRAQTIQAQDAQQNEQSALNYIQKNTVDIELKKIKLKNMQIDAQLKRQKYKDIKQRYRLQYVNGVYECFTEAFSNVKNFLIDLKLTQQQNLQFQKNFEKSLQIFADKLKEYIASKDKQDQDQSNEVSNIE